MVLLVGGPTNTQLAKAFLPLKQGLRSYGKRPSLNGIRGRYGHGMRSFAYDPMMAGNKEAYWDYIKRHSQLPWVRRALSAQSKPALLRLLIMGPPGSGKGTVSERIVKDFGVKHLSSGDLLRANIRGGTDYGKEAKSFVEKGELVPDELVEKIIFKEMREMGDVAFLLDGFPRTVTQAEHLRAVRPPDNVIQLDVPFDIIIDRISKRWLHAPSGRVYNLDFNPPKVAGKDDATGEPLTQRKDDTPEAVRARLETYHKWETPVAEFFKKKGILTTFKGKATNEIWPHVFAFLNSITPAKQKTEYPKF